MTIVSTVIDMASEEKVTHDMIENIETRADHAATNV